MKCKIHGIALRVLKGGMRPRCPACLGQAGLPTLERMRVRAQVALEDERQRQRIACALPPLYEQAGFDDFVPVTPRADRIRKAMEGYCASFKAGRAPSRGFIFHGGQGTGKTLLAAAMANALLDAGRTVRYRTLPGLTMVLRASYRNPALPSTDAVVADLLSCDLLVLDEVDLHGGSPSDYQFLFNVIDGRYSAQDKPIMLLTNKAMADLQVDLHERLIARVLNGSQPLLFEWPSQRGSKAQKVCA